MIPIEKAIQFFSQDAGALSEINPNADRGVY